MRLLMKAIALGQLDPDLMDLLVLMVLFAGLYGYSIFFTHSTHDRHLHVFTCIVFSFYFFAQFTFWQLKVLTDFTGFCQQGEVPILNAYELIIISLNIWNIHVVSRRANIFIFFASENINSNKVYLGMTMLSSLGS